MAVKTIGRDARKQEVREPAAAPATECVHHWVIASPEGATSLGRCKICGKEKEFPNSAEDWLWERDVPQSRWTGRTELTSPVEGY